MSSLEVLGMLYKFLTAGMVWWGCLGFVARATEPLPVDPEPSYSTESLEVELLTNPTAALGRRDVITADNISERYLTNPSLWWTRDQLPNKLVLNWLVYPQRKYVDVIVNPQFWNLLDYGERYSLINRYGIIAGKQGYNVRIFNLRFSDRKPIVAYSCNVNTIDRACRIQWQENNQKLLDVDNLGR
jgi:hypothetical protein